MEEVITIQSSAQILQQIVGIPEVATALGRVSVLQPADESARIVIF